MFIAKIIGYISTVFWLFPPIRQFKSDYFYYFLVLGLSDPINLFCLRFFGFPPHIIHPIAALLLFFTLDIPIKNIKKKIYFNLLVLTGFFICFIYIENHLYLILIFHIMILLKLTNITLIGVHERNILNVFYLALCFYELSVVINLSEFLGSHDVRIIIYYMTLSFQLLMAIFFTIFTEKSKFLIVKLKSAN